MKQDGRACGGDKTRKTIGEHIHGWAATREGMMGGLMAQCPSQRSSLNPTFVG
jgi:hypothetical protein